MAVPLIAKDHEAGLESLAALRAPAALCEQSAATGIVGHRNRTDEELSRLGDAGMEELFRRHDDALFRFCLGLVGQADEAADAVQTVWERALGTFSKRRGAIMTVRSWLYTVARNECLDRIRAGAARRAVDVDHIEFAGGLSAEEQHLQRLELEVLLTDLGGLSERQRAALVLREFAGFEADELAEQLGTSPSRALGLVAAARRGLIERRNGRRLPCSTAQHALTRVRRRSCALQAHLDSCIDCQYFERRRRGRALSSLAVTPLLFARGVAERLFAIAPVPPEVAKIADATAVVIASVAIGAAPFDHDARPLRGQTATSTVQPLTTAHQRPAQRPQPMTRASPHRHHAAARSTANPGPRTEANAAALLAAAAMPRATPPKTAPTTASPTPPQPTGVMSQPTSMVSQPAVAAALDDLAQHVHASSRSDPTLTTRQSATRSLKSTSDTALPRLSQQISLP